MTWKDQIRNSLCQSAQFSKEKIQGQACFRCTACGKQLLRIPYVASTGLSDFGLSRLESCFSIRVSGIRAPVPS